MCPVKVSQVSNTAIPKWLLTYVDCAKMQDILRFLLIQCITLMSKKKNEVKAKPVPSFPEHK